MTMRESNVPTIARHSIVHGRVQGVGFRYWARSAAADLRLAGWVRNRDDGTVELVVQGPSDRVSRFEALLQKGPPGAEVTSVESTDITPRRGYTRFSITV